VQYPEQTLRQRKESWLKVIAKKRVETVGKNHP
jgi:hypothetical protein